MKAQAHSVGMFAKRLILARRTQTAPGLPQQRVPQAPPLATVSAALLALFVLASPAAFAQATFTVTKTADTNDGACDLDCSLREAIIVANAISDANIVVPADTYTLTIAGNSEDLSATGDLDIRSGMTISGAGARNTIIDGGGIDRVFHMPTQMTVTPFTVNIIGVKITGGVITNEAGGGIAQFARGANLNLTISTVSGNSASQAGGIHNGAEPGFGGTMTIDRSTISGNRSDTQGGGIQNQTTLTLLNTTVSGNETNIGGGIISSGTLRISDSTIAFNTADNNSGGIYASSGATLKNTIVANNRSDFAFGKNCSDPVTSEGHNLENGTTCGFVQPGDINAGPKLGPLANYGGPTDTHALLAGSPAVDAVTAGCPPPTTDQRGIPRPQDGNNDSVARCDIGAFEQRRSDIVICAGLPATRIGTPAGETIIGTPGRDVIQGLGGNDVIRGLAGNDVLCGGPGNDRLFGGPGADRLFGETGIDRLNGEAGFDRCNGGPPATGDTAAGCEQRSNVP